MENLPNYTRAGSTAFVIETSTTYILNHSKEWKKIENNTELPNEIIGDIETALDEIIAIQNQLIGGDA